MQNCKITKSNAIINSSYRLSMNELRIVLYGLSHIDPTADEFPLFHRINIKELAKLYNIGEKDRGSFYDNIKDALINKFWDREFSYFDEERQEVVKRRWLIEVSYGRKDGTLSYHYNPMIKNQLQQLANKFTSYFLSNIANMKSVYAIRLYEIAIMFINASQRTKTTFIKTVDDLKHHLDIADKYKYFYHLKARVLEPAKKEINKYSDIRISYEIIKLGRAAHEIKFTVTRKEEIATVEKQLLPKPSANPQQREQLSTITLEKAQKIILGAGTRWDLYDIEQQFFEFIEKKGPPRRLEGAFLGFVKKKVERRP